MVPRSRKNLSRLPFADRVRDPVGEDPVALVDTHAVVAGPGIDGDLCDLLALEAEVGRAVVTDVDLENAGLAGLQTKRDPVAPFGALDREQAVLERRVLELRLLAHVRGLVGLGGGRGVARTGHDPGCSGDDGSHGDCRSRQPRFRCR